MVTVSKPRWRVEVDDAPFRKPNSHLWNGAEGLRAYRVAVASFIQATKRVRTGSIGSRALAEHVKAECEKLCPDIRLKVTEYSMVSL